MYDTRGIKYLRLRSPAKQFVPLRQRTEIRFEWNYSHFKAYFLCLRDEIEFPCTVENCAEARLFLALDNRKFVISLRIKG